MTILKKMKVHRSKKKTLLTKTDSQDKKPENERKKLRQKIEGSMNVGDKSIAKKNLSIGGTTNVIKEDNKSIKKASNLINSTVSSSKLSLNCDKQSKAEGKIPAKLKKRKRKTSHQHEKRDLKSKTPEMCSTPDQSEIKNSKQKKPLTVRQLHKRKKLMEKRKARKKIKKGKIDGEDEDKDQIDSKGDDNEEKTSENSETAKIKTERIILPKNVVEATSNWRKLQMTMKQKAERKTQKRKADQTQLRNPKYRKVDEKTISEKIISEVNKPKKEEKSQEIWFDDVDESLVDDKFDENKDKDDKPVRKVVNEDDSKLVKPEAFKGLTKLIGMDCEMVGVRNNQSVLARVSIVNRYGEQLYDKFVKPTEKVTDYRTSISGIRPEDLEKGESFNKVRQEVADILKGRTLIGHALKNDLQVLRLHHPKGDIRDTSTFETFRKFFDNKTPGLRKLTAKVLSVKIQQGEHSSVQDAQAAVRLYMLHKTQWEAEIKNTGKARKKKKKVVKTVIEKDNVDQLEKIDRLWDV